MEVKGKKFLVLGLGKSGLCAAQLLAKRGAIVKVSESLTSNEVIRRKKDLYDKYGVLSEIGGHTKMFCKDAGTVIVSPGIDMNLIYTAGIVDKSTEVLGEMELGYRFAKNAPIIAITGTNGKSTVTELIGKIFSLSGRHTVVCGNIGNPLCGEVDVITEKSVIVLEVSSFHLETIKYFRPHIAILLNVTEDHYERHGDMATYKFYKFKIFENQTQDDWAVLHTDLKNEALTEKIKSKIVFYDAASQNELKLDEAALPIKGIHNLDNIACVIKIARIMGVDLDVVKRGIETFKGLDHRFETVASYKGIDFIDDSKATNIDATKRALESVDKKVVLIAGGKDKGGDYRTIKNLIREKVKVMVLIGEAKQKIKEAFSEGVPVVFAKDMREAVDLSFSKASAGDIVLLSPMCSSFDMYTSYKERGNIFQQEVKKILGNK
ncbi:MAG: UDP-N-acetylmuramoyl-L-alanine--D-glutamate ligase [Candidatus Omnitrophica bacterium]|nr:UDP-N-acetylmuramoyl-L-alanine--D-glutamate ligase [Candidatus Omnitrophota bacterium]